MKQSALAKWLKFIIIGVGVCALLVYAVVVPMLGQYIAVAEDGAFDYAYLPWLILIWITALPCCGALVAAWRIASNIGADRSFTLANAKLLRTIALLAAGDAAYFFCGNVVFLFLNMSHPGVILFCVLPVVFLGVAVSVASAALSHLVQKAAALQEQSDLTV